MITTGTTEKTAATDTQSQNSASRAQDQKNQFLQLLVAQLKGQNPLNPMDGTAFVGQLAQFSSLEELTKINGNLESVQDILNTHSASTATKTETKTETKE